MKMWRKKRKNNMINEVFKRRKGFRRVIREEGR
jgi:hypothetical protein